MTAGFPADNERHALLRDQAATTIRVIVGDEVERPRALFVERAFGALGTEPGSAYAVQVVDRHAGIGEGGPRPRRSGVLAVGHWHRSSGSGLRSNNSFGMAAGSWWRADRRSTRGSRMS